VYVAEEKIFGAELDPGPSGPLSLKMIHRIIFLALWAPRRKFSFLSDFLAVSRQANKKICKPKKRKFIFFSSGSSALPMTGRCPEGISLRGIPVSAFKLATFTQW